MKQSTKTNELLQLLKEYRILTVEQLAWRMNASPQMVRRWIRPLKRKNRIKDIKRTAPGKGRPPLTLSLASAEIKPHLIEHQLALNTIRIHFERMQPVFCRFMPYVSRESKIGIPLTPNGQQNRYCIPDGVFTLSKEKKVLLFFLEVDRGTEPLRATREGATDIQEKLDMYRVIFATKKYKRFEKTFNCTFVGFRMLLIATTRARHESLCGFVASEPYCDFVWLTDLETLVSQGATATIWAKGGISEQVHTLLGRPVLKGRTD